MSPEQVIDDVKVAWALGNGPYDGAAVCKALDTAGYAIVPIRLTREMRRAGARALDGMTNDKESLVCDVHAAMLKAAPK